ncbi:MAG: hypothetical protein GX265_05575 [Mollicutes bacterium]|nr:hypothetical protein [Mollicutes bacterium]
MKVVKKIILIIISIFVMGIRVEAATNDTGICYKKKAVETGYCELTEAVTIKREAFAHQPLSLTNGQSPSKYNYFGKVEGEDRDMFCIDSNLPEPGSQTYKYARSFDIQTDYDRAIAKIYAEYINDVVYRANHGSTLDEALEYYKQAANVAMRAITIKYGYNIVDGSVYTNHFGNVYKQLEGKTAPDPKLVTTSDAYNIVRRYYCSGIISCLKCDRFMDALTECKKVQGANASLREFKFNFSVDANNIENTGTNRNKIEKRVPVKITGLNTMYIESYEVTNPRFYINSVKCDNNKLSCTFEDTNLPTTNLVQKNRNEYTFYIKVSGSVDDIKNMNTTKILIDYKYNHILDSKNLAVLRYHLTEQYRQRMIIFMPMRQQNADVSLIINNPTVCERRNGKYYYNENEVTISSYLRNGCCDVEYKELTNASDRQYYLQTCATKDIVDLDTKCDNDGNPNNMSVSTVQQLKTIDAIEELLKEAEATGNSTKIKQLNNNLDDEYLYRGNEVESYAFDSRNDYCKLYTTENQYIYFPGTTESKSGRFFVFDNQPRVEGTIYALFYTDYNRWKRDYDAAILDEKNKYDDWQVALALADAVDNLGTCTESSDKCECKCCSTSIVKRTNEAGQENSYSYCSGGYNCDCKYQYYVNGKSTQSVLNDDTFYDRDGKTITRSASLECKCGGEKYRTSKPNVTKAKSDYDAAVRAREKLETYKLQCESRSKIASKWRYYLEPDLKFTYKQKYYNPKTNTVQDLVTEVPLEVSWRSEKYWPNVSTQPQKIPGMDKGSYTEEKIEVIYGGGSTYKNETKSFDTTKFYSTAYTQTLYYIPTEKYFSLLPDGQYVTSQTIYQGIRQYVDIGYVFNVEITNYENEYYTWFSMDKIGHLMRNPIIKPKMDSNIQKSLDEELAKIDDQSVLKIYRDENMNQTMFNNVCYYHNDEIIYKSDCIDCSDNKFAPQYFSRSVATDNIFPNEGASGRKIGANWTSDKGKAARELIEKIGDAIYSDIDGSKDLLDATIILTPTRMLKIKQNYRNFQEFQTMDCNKYAKECKSSLLTEWATESGTYEILRNAREKLWKYYLNNIWKKGNMKQLLPGGYPEEDAGLTDWP